MRKVRRLMVAVVGVVVIGAGVGACGSSSHPDLQSAPTVNPTKDDGQDGAILAAYRASLADFNKVSTTRPLNPNDPQLEAHMAGDELGTVKQSLAKLRSSGQVDTGGLRSVRASVTQFNGQQAVIVACELDTSGIVQAQTGQTVPGGAPGKSTELVNDLAVLEGGSWKISEDHEISKGCK